ncbi:MAG: hypothetical protein A2Z20_06285 [Bdellovibrionales bacterium RBG_16_40_8]|nr:MAG: hypothetical protein A2Z20_06285 [Bdellovibrionales bacterium RBG_16_40_8]
MQNILLYGDVPENTARIRTAIESLLHYKVFEVYYNSSLEMQINSRIFNLAVVDCNELNEEVLGVVKKFKNSGQTFPILIITNKVSQQMQGQLNMLSDLYTLVRPILDKSIVGLVKKLLTARKVPKQNSRRFNTDQIAHIEELSSGSSVLLRMYNLSMGGAYCEFDAETPITVGDFYRFKVYLDHTQREHTLSAKVVWMTGRGRISGRCGCGLKFVTAKDVNSSLMSKI